MQKKLSKTSLLLMILLAAFFAISFFAFTPSFSYAEQLGGNFSVTIKKNGIIVAEDSTSSYQSSVLHFYQWKNSNEIVLSYTYDATNPPPKNSKGEQKYNMNITVQYLKAYSDSSENWPVEHLTFENFYSFSELTTISVNKNITINLDTGITGIPNGQREPVTISGWGIYRFILEINGDTSYSDFYFIEPESEIETAPETTFKTIPSAFSLNNAYEFSIKNSSAFKYIDENKLKWYVTGETQDGTKYVLLESDLNDSLHDFSEYSNYLFQTIDRNGKTFKFDTEKAGKWDVWCEYFNSTSGETLKSENAQVETGTQKDMTFVVYIVLGLGAAAVIGVTIGAAVRSKKEKIW